MDSRQRFVLVYTIAAMVPFVALTFLNVGHLSFYVSAYTLEYFALRIVLNPKMRVRVDALGLALLVVFLYFIWAGLTGTPGLAST